jgi:hypothetical protein
METSLRSIEPGAGSLETGPAPVVSGCRSRSRGKPPPARIAARWPSQRPSLVHRRRCELTELPRGAHPSGQRLIGRLLDFTSPPARPAPGRTTQFVVPPPLGLASKVPLLRTLRVRSLQKTDRNRPSSGCGCQPQRPGPSSRFRTTSTSCTTHGRRASCSPVTDMGFDGLDFAHHRDRALAGRVVECAETSPIATPSKGFPSPAAVPRHRGRCPPVVRRILTEVGTLPSAAVSPPQAPTAHT